MASTTRFGLEGYGVRPAGAFALTVSGALAVTEAPDVAVFAGGVGAPSGTWVSTEAADIAAFAGSVVAVPSGILVVTEALDRAAFQIDYTAPRQIAAPSPYPSILDYGWYNSEPPIRKGGPSENWRD